MRYASFLTTFLFLLAVPLALPGCAGSKSSSQQTTATIACQPQKPDYAAFDCEVDPDSLFESASTSGLKTIRVKAMAYTSCSVGKKRHKRPVRGAWGDSLTRDMKAVAVSPDLLDMGLEHGDIITIEGLPGQYKVLDLMHSRHSKSIDIFYGDDQCGALAWGRRTLTISWR